MINLIGAYIFSILLVALFVERAEMRGFAARLDRHRRVARVILPPLLILLGLQHAEVITATYGSALIGVPFMLISGFTLWMHEAGHIYFRPFGVFMMFAGGTLNELLFPLLLAWWGQRNRFNVTRALAVSWLGLNLLRATHYIADARAMKLRLLGAGDSKGHDWNNMLSMLGLLEYDQVIAAAATSAGAAILLSGIGLLLLPGSDNRLSPS